MVGRTAQCATRAQKDVHGYCAAVYWEHPALHGNIRQVVRISSAEETRGHCGPFDQLAAAAAGAVVDATEGDGSVQTPDGQISSDIKALKAVYVL